MKTNQAGINLIKNAEGLRLKAYKDSVGVLTIGYGHTGADVTENLVITPEKAEQLLIQDLSSAENAVTKDVKVSITDNQFAALVSFIFNLGAGTLLSSTLLKKLNANDKAGAAEEFLKWVHAGGKVLPGLVQRREAEKALFLA